MDASIRGLALRSVELGQRAMAELAHALAGPLGEAMERAADVLLATSGRLIVCGVGKSGHVGGKIAATMASTGTPAFFVHPTEASHGDLGMIAAGDIILALSWSGETAELSDLLIFAKRFAITLIGITSKADSTLGRSADIALVLPAVKESCPHDLAPTSSSLIQLALGDALAVSLLEKRGFTSERFKALHPGGKLAARLKTVDQLMHSGEDMPLVKAGVPMSDALLEIAGRRFGCAGVTDGDGALIGMVTDGDLRRHMGPAILETPVEDVMTAQPIVFGPEFLASAALDLMNRRRIMAAFVVAEGRPLGIIHIHDLIRAGVA